MKTSVPTTVTVVPAPESFPADENEMVIACLLPLMLIPETSVVNKVCAPVEVLAAKNLLSSAVKFIEV